MPINLKTLKYLLHFLVITNKRKHEHKDFLSFYKDTKRFGALATVIYYILTSFTLVWFVVIKLINIIADGITIMFNRI